MPDGFFSFRELDRRRVAIILERSLQDLVDRRAPITAIQFRLACRGPAGVSSKDYVLMLILCIIHLFLQSIEEDIIPNF